MIDLTHLLYTINKRVSTHNLTDGKLIQKSDVTATNFDAITNYK